jgi:ABC-2 type transport system permease protein
MTVIETPGINPVRQLAALFKMELLLLMRNRAATLLVALLPLAIGYIRLRGYEVGSVGERRAATQLASLLGIIPVLFIHHHLVTVYATRRQELVLKRLRAGLPSERTILAGAASATVALCLVQALIFAGYGVLVLGLPVPANPLTVLLALLLIAALMTTFSALMSVVTRSSEAAMVTTFPTMAIFLATPGMLVPFGTFPKPLEQAAWWFSPVGPFAELVRDGWLGRGGDGTGLSFLATLVDAVSGLAVMSGWLVLTLVLVRWFFRWEPRHS